MYRALLIAASLLPVVACASAQAKAPVELVALEVPPVPPRLVEPTPVEPPPLPAVGEITAQVPSPTPQKPRVPTREANRSEPKPEAKPEPDPDVIPQPPPTPVPPLRTGNAPAAEAERQVRDIIQRARQLLGGVDTRGWSEDRVANYESAKDSLTRAEEAIKASNWVLARQVAERAENIAKLLISR